MNKFSGYLTLVDQDDVEIYNNGHITIEVMMDTCTGQTVDLYTTIEKLEKLVKEAKQAIQENKE